MFVYRYDRPLHISAESLEKAHAMTFHYSGRLELTIDSKDHSWTVSSQAPLNPAAWCRPREGDQATAADRPWSDEAQMWWVHRQAMSGSLPHSVVISGTQLTEIGKLPMESLWHEVIDGWLRVVLHGPAQKLRPQPDALMEIEISSNSRLIADRIAHYLGAKVVSHPKRTLAFLSELPRLFRPPIANASYFPPRDSVLRRIASDKRALCSHAVIAGAVGSGKTNTMLNILDHALNLGATGICVIDPFDNFRQWAAKHSITYLDVGRKPRDLAYLNCNPLVCPNRMRLGAHLDLLSDLLACAVSGGGGTTLPFYVRKAVDAFFRETWSLDESQFARLLDKTGAELRKSPQFHVPPKALAHLSDWWKRKRETVVHEIFAGNPSGDLGNLKHILQSRISELTKSGLSHFNYAVHRGLDGLHDRRVVVSLQGCSPSEADLIMGTLSTYYVSTALLRDPRDRLENLLAIDEAHRVMGKTKPGSNEFETIGETLGKYLGQAIRELRSRGVACVLADQDVTQLADEAQSTTGIQIYHRSSGANIASFLEKLLEGVPVDLPALPTGTAVCKFLDDPVTVEHIPLWNG